MAKHWILKISYFLCIINYKNLNGIPFFLSFFFLLFLVYSNGIVSRDGIEKAGVIVLN